MQNDHETRFIGTRASPSSYGARFIVLAGRCDAIDSEWAGLFFISQSAHFVFRIMLINKSIYVTFLGQTNSETRIQMRMRMRMMRTRHKQ